LYCPFGCREAHRRQRSTRRSVEYYRTKEGKYKKKAHNGRRKRQERTLEPDSRKKPEEEISHPDAKEGDWNARMVKYVRMVTSLIEGRRVSLEEILEMLRRALRQHRMGPRRRIDYIVGDLNKASP
jgi:hypothetical protein